MIPCPFDESHRRHWVDKQFMKPADSCKLYLETISLQGHEENCDWEGYIAVKKCGCVKVEPIKKPAPKKDYFSGVKK